MSTRFQMYLTKMQLQYLSLLVHCFKTCIPHQFIYFQQKRSLYGKPWPTSSSICFNFWQQRYEQTADFPRQKVRKNIIHQSVYCLTWDRKGIFLCKGTGKHSSHLEPLRPFMWKRFFDMKRCLTWNKFWKHIDPKCSQVAFTGSQCPSSPACPRF